MVTGIDLSHSISLELYLKLVLLALAIKNKFDPKSNDKVWQLCQKGRDLFWKGIVKEYNGEYAAPPGVPAYKRAIMLLEKEVKFETAINLCKDVLRVIDNNWYTEKMELFAKKLIS